MGSPVRRSALWLNAEGQQFVKDRSTIPNLNTAAQNGRRVHTVAQSARSSHVSSRFVTLKLQLDVKPVIENLPSKFRTIEEYFKQQPYRANDRSIAYHKIENQRIC